MNCLERHIIQQYFDGECTVQEVQEIKVHIAECPACAQELKNIAAFTHKLNSHLDSMVVDPAVIPEFSAPAQVAKRERRHRFKFVAGIAAACLIALVLVVWPKGDKSSLAASAIVINDDVEVDANLPYTEQKMEIKIIDVEGNVTNYILE